MLHTSLTERLKGSVTKMHVLHRTVHMPIGMVVCKSCSCHYTSQALPASPRQELQTVFRNLFTRCQANL